MARWAGSLVFVLLVSIGAMAAGVGQAVANDSQSHHSSFQFSGRVDCGSFADRFTDRYSIEGKTFFDRSGEAVRTIDHVRHTSTDRNSKTGLILHQHDRYNLVTDLRTGTIRIAGGTFRINRPGRGMVVHDVGRIVFDRDRNVIFTAGKHQVIGQDSTVFCAALS